MPVKILGYKYPFLVDTGMTLSGVDKTLRAVLDTPLGSTKVRTHSQALDLELFAPPVAHVGELPMAEDEPVMCVDLSPGDDLLPPIGGVLGMAFLRKHIVQIDPDRSEVRLLGVDSKPTPDWGVAFELAYGQGGIPQIRAKVKGKGPIVFSVDLGSVKTAHLSEESSAKLGLLDSEIVREYWADGLGGALWTADIRAGPFTLGPFTHENLVFTAGKTDLLGLNYFMRYRMTFDFPRHRLYLAPSRRYADFDRSDLDGITLERKHEGAYVHSVWKGSSGFAAGLWPNDRIVSVDDHCADERPIWWLNHYLTRTTKSDIKLLVQRGDNEVVVVTLPAGKPIAPRPPSTKPERARGKQDSSKYE